MARCRHRKLRAAVRWTVWVCTVLLILLIPVSIWGRPGAMLMHNSNGYSNRGVTVLLSGSRFTFLYSSGRPVHPYDPPPIVGFDFEYWHRWPTAEKRSKAQLLSPVWWVGGQSIRGAEVSLMYPAVFGAVWSYLIWHRRRRFPAGHCEKCGYSLAGLSAGVCPECGETHGEA
jgi:hypothetical protein